MIKNLLITAFFTLIGFTMFGQLTFEPDVLEFSADTTVNRAEFHFTITNEGTDTETFWWTIDRGQTPDEWVYAVCDINQCYVDGLETCPCSIPNVLAPGEFFEFTIYLLANKTVGSSDINFILTKFDDIDNCQGQQNVLELPMVLSSTGSTSSIDLESDEFNLNVYPNPTTDYFQVMNDDNVSQIVVSNIIGKKVIETPHYKGETHQVSQLDKGLYLVRMIDKNSNILDVKRITIE